MTDPAALAARPRADWLPLVLVGGYTTVSGITTFWLPIFFSEQLGYSGAQIGLLFSVQAITGVLAAIPAGFGNDRITSRTMIVLGFILQALTLCLMATTRRYLAYTVVFFAFSFAINLVRISFEMQVLKTDTGGSTSRRMGTFTAWRFGGLGVGVIATGFLLGEVRFELALYVAAAAFLVLIAGAFFLKPTPLARHGMGAYLADLKSPRVLLFIGWLFLFTTHWGVEQTCYSLFLKKDLGLSLQAMGWYMAVEFAALIVMVRWAAPRMDQGSMASFAILGLACSGIGHIGMVVPDVYISVVFRGLHGCGDGVITTIMYLGISRLFSVTRLGGNTGAINLALTAGMIAGATIAGPVGERYGYGLPIWVSGVVLLLLALPLVARKLAATRSNQSRAT